MKKTLIILGIILQISFGVSAQSKLPPLSLKNIQFLAFYISKNYHVDEKLENSCTNSFTFMKFKVNKAGEIKEIDFTKGTRTEIKDALTKAILATNGVWEFDEKEKEIIEQKTFILPFVYYYQAGCSPGEVEVSTRKLRKLQPVTTAVDMKAFDNIGNILHFENSSYEMLESVLLGPMRVSSKQ